MKDFKEDYLKLGIDNKLKDRKLSYYEEIYLYWNDIRDYIKLANDIYLVYESIYNNDKDFYSKYQRTWFILSLSKLYDLTSDKKSSIYRFEGRLVEVNISSTDHQISDRRDLTCIYEPCGYDSINLRNFYHQDLKLKYEGELIIERDDTKSVHERLSSKNFNRYDSRIQKI